MEVEALLKYILNIKSNNTARLAQQVLRPQHFDFH